MGQRYYAVTIAKEGANAFANEAFTALKFFAFVFASCDDEGRCTSDLIERATDSAIEA